MEKPLHGCRRGLRRKVPEENEPLHDSAKGCDAQAAFLGLGSPSASYRNLARRNRMPPSPVFWRVYFTIKERAKVTKVGRNADDLMIWIIKSLPMY